MPTCGVGEGDRPLDWLVPALLPAMVHNQAMFKWPRLSVSSAAIIHDFTVSLPPSHKTLIPRTIGNIEKEIVREVARGDKHYLRNLHIAKHKSVRC